jgi:hypothetical protein
MRSIKFGNYEFKIHKRATEKMRYIEIPIYSLEIKTLGHYPLFIYDITCNKTYTLAAGLNKDEADRMLAELKALAWSE